MVNPLQLTQIGRYAVRRYITEGGMAWVFEVTDPRFTGEVVRALKLLKPEAARGEEFERFKDEASLLAGFNHPNLVTIFDLDLDEGTECQYYTMTYVDGPTLAEHIEQNGPLTPKRAVEVFDNLLSGLAELHRHPSKIVHRDIKPSNVLMTRDGRAILADLGIARVAGASRLTKTGFAVGTALYMSPEQARAREVLPSSDIFSVGFTLYEALAAHNVYAGVEGVDSTSEYDVLGYLAACGRSGREIEIDFTEGRINEDLAEVIRTACKYEAKDRYQDASEMLEALRAVDTSEEAVPSKSKKKRKKPPKPRKPRAPGERPRWLIPAAIGGVVAAILAYVGFQLIQRGAATDVIVDAEAIRASVSQLESAAGGLASLPTELRDSLVQGAAEADEQLAAARRHLDNRYWEAAEISAGKAIAALDTPCRTASVELGASVNEMVGQVTERHERLRETGAPEFVPTDWEAFNAEIAAIPAATEASGCGSVLAEMGRRKAVLKAITSASILGRQVELTIPDALESLASRVTQTRALAEARAVTHPTYDARMAAGAEAEAKGTAALETEDHRTAYVELNNAQRAYREAEQLYDAANAQLEVRGLERQLFDLQGSPPDKVSVLISSAETSFESGEYPTAAQRYLDAAEQLVGVIADAQLAAEKKAQSQQIEDEELRQQELAAKQQREAERAANQARLDELAARRREVNERQVARQREAAKQVEEEKKQRETVIAKLESERPPPEPPAVNDPPNLTVTPAASRVSLSVGERHVFSARATDPENQTIKLFFEMDGKLVSESAPSKSGTQVPYAFEPKSPGTHTLQIYAKDNEQRSNVVRVAIDVKGGWQADVTQAIRGYENALNRRSMSELQNVWPYIDRAPDFARWERLIANPDLEVNVELVQISRDASDEARATVMFKETQRMRGRERVVNRQARLTRRGQRDWKIDGIGSAQ